MKDFHLSNLYSGVGFILLLFVLLVIGQYGIAVAFKGAIQL